MSTLFELMDEILKGRRAKRKKCINYWFTTDMMDDGLSEVAPEDIFADDWELEELPKVKKKVKLYAFYDGNIPTGFKLTAHPELTNILGNMTRLPNLDQEIEVDE